jgi:hypothetical protein
MSPELLIQLNAGAQTQTQSAPDMQSAALMAAAAAAHFANINPSKPTDPGIKMAKTLEKLRANPIEVPAGLDDRISVLHDGRYLPGTVASAKKQWLDARKRLGMEGTDPLATYDMAACGLGGNVTNQGWLHLANPGSSGLCLKQFSSANIGNTAGFSRRFSLAEGEAAINVGDNLKEIADMKSLTQAMRTLDLAARHAMNWNYSISALYCFLEGNEYCAAELANHPNRVGEVVNFVNHVLGVNAQNWIKEECFLTAPELSREFPIWLQSRPSTAATTAATAPGPNPNKNNQQQTYKGWSRGRGGFHNNRGGGHSGGYHTGGGGQQGSGSGQYGSGGGFGGGQHKQPQGSNGTHPRGGGGNARSNATKIVCRRYNAGTCTNHYSRCFLPISHDKAWHICNVTDPQTGAPCHEYHPAYKH